ALLATAVRETLDPDMWWHLRTGKYILQNGLPRQDVFSFTVPHHAWVTHEWLSQVVMWLVYRVGGFPGLIIAFAGLIALTFWLVYRVCAGRPYLAGFVTLWAAFAAAIVWGARPQIFNLLLTAVFIFILEKVRAGANRRWLWLLPPLTALWANLHSGYLLGVVLLGTVAVGEVISDFGFRISDYRLRNAPLPASRSSLHLFSVTAVSFLAAVLNPAGVGLWLYPFETLGSPAMQAYIQEWHSPDFHNRIFWPFAGLIFLGVLAWVWRRERPSVTDMLLFLGTAAAGLLSARHIPLFAIVAAPIISRALAGAMAGTRLEALVNPPDQPVPRRLAALNWGVVAVMALAVAAWTAVKISGNETAVQSRYPAAAVDYLDLSGLAQQPGYNSYNWGGYLIWRGIPVFVDGRADVYGDAFLFTYLQTFEATPQWQEPLAAYDVAYVLMERGSPLTAVLEADAGWQEVYADGLAQVFVRR
ncbi:MAG: hypothetical protein ACE5EY_14670, partial [Anaerolineae bacterium]